MTTCRECIHFEVCEPYTAPDESYPEVGGCRVFKNKDEFVQVVRCKECKYLTRLARGGYGYALQCGYRGHLTYENDYCAGGRRRATNEAD